MRILFLTPVFAAYTFAIPAAQAAEPVTIAPSSPWQMEYADDSCRLIRRFGSDNSLTYLTLERFEPGNAFQLVISGKSFRRIKDRGEAVVRFGAGEQPNELPYFKGRFADTTSMLFGSSVNIGLATDIVEPVREAAAEYVSVDTSGIPETILQTGSLGPPFAALRTCTDELLGHWGIDVEAHKTLSQSVSPRTSPNRWLSSEDYPAGMLSHGDQGVINVRVDVGADGNPLDCHVQKETKPEGFADVVCEAVMRRARFTPALDAQGNPLRSYYITAVRFQMAQ